MGDSEALSIAVAVLVSSFDREGDRLGRCGELAGPTARRPRSGVRKRDEYAGEHNQPESTETHLQPRFESAPSWGIGLGFDSRRLH
jgi:hypothetical protein